MKTRWRALVDIYIMHFFFGGVVSEVYDGAVWWLREIQEFSEPLLMRKMVIVGESGIFENASSAANSGCGRIRNILAHFECHSSSR